MPKEGYWGEGAEIISLLHNLPNLPRSECVKELAKYPQNILELQKDIIPRDIYDDVMAKKEADMKTWKKTKL